MSEKDLKKAVENTAAQDPGRVLETFIGLPKEHQDPIENAFRNSMPQPMKGKKNRGR